MSAGDLERAAKDLFGRCMAKFDDAALSMDFRAFSLSIVTSQIRQGNVAVRAYLPEICRRLEDPAVLAQPVTGTGAVDFHRQIVDAVSVVFDSVSENHSGGGDWLASVVRYLVDLVSCRDVEIASRACQFLADYSGVSVNVGASSRRQWMTVVKPSPLPKLLTALMDRMILREDTASADTLCRRSADALESIAGVYPVEQVCATCIPLLETRIESDSWWEKEAAIRAIGALTNGGQ